MAKLDDDETGEPHRRASPVRARPPKPTDAPDPLAEHARSAINGSPDDRVFVIAQYIAQGRWNRHTALMLSNLWALSPGAIREFASDAARYNRLLKGRDGFVAARDKVQAMLETAFDMAVAGGDAKAAVAAAKTLGEMAGVFAPKKIANTDADGKALPPAPPMPPQVAVFVNNEAALRFWAATGRRPTPAQVAQLEAGVPPEEVARSAGLLQGLPSRS